MSLPSLLQYNVSFHHIFFAYIENEKQKYENLYLNERLLNQAVKSIQS